jgi:hypothetical protein
MQNRNLKYKYPMETDMNQCRSYLLCQVKEREQKPAHSIRPGPAITLSYQTGAGEHEIATRIAEILQAGESGMTTPWTVFDRRLVERVLKEHQFPESMARFLPEDRRTFVEEEIGDLLGLHPPAWVIVPQIAETILHLANAGHAILVGRGAAFITARMENVFHVRLVAPLSNRIDRVRMTENMSAKEAVKYIAEKDRGRSRYAKAYFHGRADDDLLYHLIVNTGRIPYITTARLIADEARQHFQIGAVARDNRTRKIPVDAN